MSDPLKTFESIKFFTSIAAPAITIFSALLGLFTKTKDTKTVTEGGRKIKKEVLNKWTWWALSGILLGFGISVWSVLNDSKINELEGKIKAAQLSAYYRKVDSVNTQLKESRDTAKAILKASGITINKLDGAYNKQLVGLKKQDNLLKQTDDLLHPLVPMIVTIGSFIN